MKINYVKFKYFSKAFDVFCFVYIAAVAYRNLKINGVLYGIYLRPIYIIPAWLMFGLAVAVQYLGQQIKDDNFVSGKEIRKDFVKALTGFSVNLNNAPLKMFLGYLWASIKTTFKNMLLFMLLLLPLGLIVAIVQAILTGNADFRADF